MYRVNEKLDNGMVEWHPQERVNSMYTRGKKQTTASKGRLAGEVWKPFSASKCTPGRADSLPCRAPGWNTQSESESRQVSQTTSASPGSAFTLGALGRPRGGK
jgi:hypothetical protein